MLVKQLVVLGCLLLVVEFLEAKTFFRYKRTTEEESGTCLLDQVRCSNGECLQRDMFCRTRRNCDDKSLNINNETCGAHLEGGISPDEMRCYTAFEQVESCVKRTNPFRENQRPGHGMFQMWAEDDTYQACSRLAPWFQCFDGILDKCSSIDNRMMQRMMQKTFVYQSYFNVVCERETEIINRHKECLLRTEDQEIWVIGSFDRNGTQREAQMRTRPRLVLKRMLTDSCAHSSPRYGDSATCKPESFIDCGKQIIAEQCGDEAAGVFERFDRRFVRVLIGCEDMPN